MWQRFKYFSFYLWGIETLELVTRLIKPQGFSFYLWGIETGDDYSLNDNYEYFSFYLWEIETKNLKIRTMGSGIFHSTYEELCAYPHVKYYFYRKLRWSFYTFHFAVYTIQFTSWLGEFVGCGSQAFQLDVKLPLIVYFLHPSNSYFSL